MTIGRRSVGQTIFCVIGFFHEYLTKSPVEYRFIFRHEKVFIHELSCLVKVIKMVRLKGGSWFLISAGPNCWHFLTVVKLAEKVFYRRD
jgi:hypothetical protein